MRCLGGVCGARCRVVGGGRVWLAGLLAVVGFGVWIGSARAVTFTQQTLAFSGLRQPQSVAVDGAGDVFVADASSGRVVELPAGGSQQTLPFSGLSATPRSGGRWGR
jgi:NHL repeat